MNRCFWPAVHQDGHIAQPLPGHRVDYIRVAGVKVHLVDPGVVTATQDLVPGIAAVGGFVQAAVATAGPERSLGRHVNRVGVLGVYPDHADMFRLLQAHIGPGLATIQALVDTVAVTDVATGDILPAAHPNGVMVIGVNGDRTDGIGTFGVKHALPGGAGINRLPDPAATDGHVPDAAVLRVQDNIGDAAGHQGRANITHFQAFEGLSIEPRVYFFLVCGEGRQDGKRQ